jgi:hypothetical protein
MQALKIWPTPKQITKITKNTPIAPFLLSEHDAVDIPTKYPALE